MAQRYIDEISQGDKRILVVNGEPVPYALARFAGKGDFRGNLAKGGSSKGVPLSEQGPLDLFAGGARTEKARHPVCRSGCDW